MIAPMTQYSFILLHGDKEKFLSELQQLGVVDITRSSKPIDSFSQSLLDNIETLRRDIECTLAGSDDTTKELSAKKNDLLKEIADAEPWGDYDRERLAAFHPHFYSVAAKKFDPSWAEQYALQTVDERDGTVRRCV